MNIPSWLIIAIVLCNLIYIGLTINFPSCPKPIKIDSFKVYTNQGVYILDYQKLTIFKEEYTTIDNREITPINHFKSINELNEWFSFFSERIIIMVYEIPKEAWPQSPFWTDVPFPIVMNCNSKNYLEGTHIKINYCEKDVDTIGWMMPTGGITSAMTYIKTP